VVLILAVWLMPGVRLVRRVVVVCYCLAGVMGMVVAASLVLPTSSTMRIGLIVAYGLVIGGSLAVAEVFTWDVLSKGMDETVRGKTLSLAFGFGPFLAVAGSIVSQVVLGEKVSWLTYPNDYAFLFAATTPIMIGAGLIGLGYYLPPVAEPEQRAAFRSFVVGGVVEFVRQRQFILLMVAYLLFNAGWYVYTNASLNVRDAMGLEPKTVAGTIQALRFGGKIVAGFLLGLLVARRGARAGAVTTGLITAAGVLWLLGVRGTPYLFAFALFGGGELAGVYYPNYCVSASDPRFVKRNTALLYLLNVPIAAAPALHGLIADYAGFPPSFWTGLVAVGAGILVTMALPYRSPARTPLLSSEEPTSSDTAQDSN